MRSNARFSACTEPCSGTGGGPVGAVLAARRVPFGRVVTEDAVVHDRHQLHELGVDPLELGVQRRHVHVARGAAA